MKAKMGDKIRITHNWKLLIVIIILIALLVILVYFILKNNNVYYEKCNSENLEKCDKFCNEDKDCANAVNCGCYNKKDVDKIPYGRDGSMSLFEPCFQPECKCINNKCEENLENLKCQNDNECIPSSCCHAESCIPKDKAPVCDKIFCSQDCSGPLDCRAGHCSCVNGKCKIIAGDSY